MDAFTVLSPVGRGRVMAEGRGLATAITAGPNAPAAVETVRGTPPEEAEV